MGFEVQDQGYRLLQRMYTPYSTLPWSFDRVAGLELVLHLGMVTLAYAVPPSQEAEARGLQVLGQPGLNSMH